MVQGTGFEPAKHYAQRPERCPFDRSGTPAWITDESHPVFQNGEHEFNAIGQLELWCRGQDLNLRSTTHWDLNPAPLTTREPLLVLVREYFHQ